MELKVFVSFDDNDFRDLDRTYLEARIKSAIENIGGKVTSIFIELK